MLSRILIIILAAAAVSAAALTVTRSRAATSLTTVAFRTHRQAEMIAFYTEAFGATFRTVQTGPIESAFGEIDALTLKLVPIRDSVDFNGFPVHQLGFEVPDIQHVIAIARRHGGKLQDAPVRTGDRLQAAIRDPDGNTIELYGPR
jgi:catechol 2,3-dioxygenase-like lactoylglutathione lyase family enzyme